LYPKIKIKNLSHKARTVIVLSEIVFIVILVICWFSFKELRESHNLWILFFYNFPSQFLIAIVPHEPVFLYFSKFYSPLVVTTVAILGTLLTEHLNYSVFKYFLDLEKFKAIRSNRFVRKLLLLFEKSPFMALIIAGFTPVPFYPFRFIVVMANYPKYKYLLAIFFSRSPRYYILASFGQVLMLSNTLLAVIFAILLLIGLIPIIRTQIKSKNKDQKLPETA
jgi:membrane protein YqaA with SNARE-associated domain